MQFLKISISISFVFLIASCKESPIDSATKWTKDIRNKVIEDASQKPDKTVFDSVHNGLILYRNNKKLKQYYFTERENRNEKEKLIFDTAMVVLYSSDQNFQVVRQLCIPGAERSYEGVTYKGNRFGKAEFVYCHKAIRETGFQYNNLNVGVWTKYDSTGKVIEQKDVGSSDKLKELQNMKYSR